MVHPTSGFYERDGKLYPSQSTVVGETDPYFNPDKLKGLEIWRQSVEDWEEVIREATDRGKYLHSLIEESLGFGVEESERIELDQNRRMQLQIPSYVNQMSEMIAYFISVQEDVLMECETEKYSETFGFACTSDLILPVSFKKKGREYEIDKISADGEYTILDWKNVRDKKDKDGKMKAKPRSQHRDNFLQLGANALAHNDMLARGEIDSPKITQGVAVALYSWRPPRFHVLNREELNEQAQLFATRVEYYKKLHGDFPKVKTD